MSESLPRIDWAAISSVPTSPDLPVASSRVATTSEGLRRLLTLDETANTLRLSPHTIRALVRKGKLFPVRICRRLLFRPADVERLISASRSTEQP